MDYRFKLNAFKKPVTLRLSERMLEAVDEGGQVARQVELGAIQAFREYESFQGIDGTSGTYPIKYCKLFVKGNKALSIRNGFYVGNYGKMRDVATNQETQYTAFLTELKRGVASVNPKAPFVSGWLLASLAWWTLALLGIGFLAMGVGGFFMDSLRTALLIALFCFPVGGILLFSGFVFGRSYWPKRVTVAKSLRDSASEESASTV